jgi:hypothetical protein
MRIRLAACIALSFCSIAYGADASARWTLQLTPRISHARGNNTLIASIADNKKHDTFKLTTDIILSSVEEAFIVGNKLAVLGDAGKTQAVVIFDLSKRKEADWYFCYEPQRLDYSSLIAYVEYYPSHSNAETTDVVLVYDLQKTPRENRLLPVAVLPPRRHDYPVAVGIPIFPAYNAQHKSYDNTVEDSDDVHNILGPPFFLMLSSKRLIFLESLTLPSGITNDVVAVNLSHGLVDSPIRIAAIPRKSFASGAPQAIQATGMKEEQPFVVSLQIPISKYGVSSVLVPIPK